MEDLNALILKQSCLPGLKVSINIFLTFADADAGHVFFTGDCHGWRSADNAKVLPLAISTTCCLKEHQNWNKCTHNHRGCCQ